MLHFNFLSKNDIRCDEYTDDKTSNLLEEAGIEECDFIYNAGKIYLVIMSRKTNRLVLFSNDGLVTRRAVFNFLDDTKRDYAKLIVPDFKAKKFSLLDEMGNIVKELDFSEVPDDLHLLIRPGHWCTLYRKDSKHYKRVFGGQ
jgi:hypothetical protein